MSEKGDDRKREQIGLLFRNKSQGGKEYFSGAVNGIKVVMFNSGKLTKNGNEMWNLLKAEDVRQPGEEG